MAEKSDTTDVVAQDTAESSEHTDNDSTEAYDDVELGRKGMILLLCNNWEDAEKLFSKYKDESAVMCSGSSIVRFLQALMTFEEEKLSEAKTSLQETERRCQVSDGFMASVRRRFSRGKRSKNFVKTEDRLQRQVIIGDSLLCQCVLTLTPGDLAAYVKEIKSLQRKIQKARLKDGGMTSSASADSMASGGSALTAETNTEGMLRDVSSYSLKSESEVPLTEAEIPEDAVCRLLGSVCFGYGALQLVISMLPPKVLKLIEFLGFEGDRDLGLRSLQYCSDSVDMKAPIATLGLLWYHTVIRPFFALDGSNQASAGVEDAKVIMEKCEREYPRAALFLFFKARLCRLERNIDEALSVYQQALEECHGEREVTLICMHEIGWCNLMKLQWSECVRCFSHLKEESRWSKAYYAYLTGICMGAMGDLGQAKEHLQDVSKLVSKRNNQIEQYCMKRVAKFRKSAVTQPHCTLLCLEMIYLWHALPTCQRDDLHRMQQECEKQSDRKLFHIMSLIEGAIHRELDNMELAQTCFEESVARHEGMKCDEYVPAFATYELGSLLLKEPKTFEQGKACLIQAKEKFKDYEFENRLNVRIHAALKQAKDEGTPI